MSDEGRVFGEEGGEVFDVVLDGEGLVLCPCLEDFCAGCREGFGESVEGALGSWPSVEEEGFWEGVCAVEPEGRYGREVTVGGDYRGLG